MRQVNVALPSFVISLEKSQAEYGPPRKIAAENLKLEAF